MHLSLILNPDEKQKIPYMIARVVYAETGARSLGEIEALTSVIANLCMSTGRDLTDICGDEKVFECVADKSAHHDRMTVDANDRGFQICLRAARRMLNGELPDAVCGAVRFHHAETLPEWATARGHIAEIGEFLFYQ